MRKRVMSILLAAAMLCVMLPAGAQAAENTGIPYEVEGGSIYFDPAAGAITGFDGAPVNVDIPAQINGTAVTSIGMNAFLECTSLANVTIPDGVTSIGRCAFMECKGLVSVAIPEGVAIIDRHAFMDCENLVSVVLPSSLTTIDSWAFSGCTSLTSAEIPDGVTFLGGNVFDGSRLSSVTIPDGITEIMPLAFAGCPDLTSVTIPASTVSISHWAFNSCESLTDVYYGGSEAQWNEIEMGDGNEPLLSASVHYNSSGPDAPSAPVTPEDPPAEDQGYIYDTADPGADTVLQPQLLEGVHDQASAVDAVKKMLAGMTPEQKQSPAGADLATLFAEEAAARAASKAVTGSDILISAAAVQDLEQTAASAAAAVESALAEGGISVVRQLSKTAVLVTSGTGPVSIGIDPDIPGTACDRIRIQTPSYALTFKAADLEPDLSGTPTFSAEEVSPGTVRVTMPGGAVSSPVTLAVIGNFGSSPYEALVSQDTGEAVSSKYNPATGNMDGRVNRSGTYAVRTNQKDFTDIGNKSAEMQNAIRVLASKGIIAGTTETTFSPNGTISRAEIAKLMVYTLGWTDSSAVSTFTDVPAGSWYSGVAAVSQKRGLINGYPDSTFRGTTAISKEQIVAVSGRVLQNEMGYRVPADPSAYLSRYKDGVSKWVQPMAALCTRENLVVQRYDGRFLGLNSMTRGDAAIIIYRLFQRIW